MEIVLKENISETLDIFRYNKYEREVSVYQVD